MHLAKTFSITSARPSDFFNDIAGSTGFDAITASNVASSNAAALCPLLLGRKNTGGRNDDFCSVAVDRCFRIERLHLIR